MSALSGRTEQIYFHAARLFVEKGFAATSMSEIAEAVGITKAGLYHFVANKEELLYNLMTWAMDVLDEDVTRPAGTIADPLQRLSLIVHAHLHNIRRAGDDAGNPFTIIMDEPAGLSPARRDLITARKRTYFRFVRETLNALKADGRLRDIDTSVAAFSILGMVVWFARWHRPGGPLSVDEIVTQMTETALRAVIRPEALADWRLKG